MHTHTPHPHNKHTISSKEKKKVRADSAARKIVIEVEDTLAVDC